MQSEKLKILFAAGGTGGHIFPALTIASEIRIKYSNSKICFVGAKNKIESKIVPQKGFEIFFISANPLQRKISIKNFILIFQLIFSFIQSFFLLLKIKPNVVVGTGGYVCGPIVFISSVLKIPTLIHEQNIFPGITTKILSKFVDEIHISFEGARKFFKVKGEKIFLTGNPVKFEKNISQNEAFNYFGFNENENSKTILVFGGSLGASSINHTMLNIIDKLLGKNIRIIWQTGETNFEKIQTKILNFQTKYISLKKFIDRMDFAYSISDLVICRAGATTISEITYLGKASILIPYPTASENHQYENAKFLSEKNAAEIILDNDLENELEKKIFEILFDETKIKSLEKNAMSLANKNSVNEIVNHIMNLSKT